MTVVQIVVAAGCAGCAEARRLAEEARRRFPRAIVDLVDLDREPARQPASVFAVPTYLLNGRVISLGTPSEAEFYRRIAEALAAEAVATEAPTAELARQEEDDDR
jgi:hypothetical protein